MHSLVRALNCVNTYKLCKFLFKFLFVLTNHATRVKETMDPTYLLHMMKDMIFEKCQSDEKNVSDTGKKQRRRYVDDATAAETIRVLLHGGQPAMIKGPRARLLDRLEILKNDGDVKNFIKQHRTALLAHFPCGGGGVIVYVYLRTSARLRIASSSQ